jgi:uncharacterized protein
MYIQRTIEPIILSSLEHNPVTAILGPRQCGKSTLAKHVIDNLSQEAIYLDLERPSDLRKLDDAEWFLETQKEKLICFDEIQRKPGLFSTIRALVDEWGGNGHFLVLGSASRELIKQSSESLAGRISYKRLNPFQWNEISSLAKLEDYISQGGFPRSLLAKSDHLSFQWREDFITTFLERDLMLWSGFSPDTMRRLWQMLANLNGQILNYSNLGSALGVSHTTVRNYADLLSATFMIQLLPPYLANTQKRLVKTPKIYLGDSGIANALLGIRNFVQLAGHPTMGAVWESVVLTNLITAFPLMRFYFYRSSKGEEIDLVIESNDLLIAIECKASVAPHISKGTYKALDDLNPSLTLVVAPVEKGWQMNEKMAVANIPEAIRLISDKAGT